MLFQSMLNGKLSGKGKDSLFLIKKKKIEKDKDIQIHCSPLFSASQVTAESEDL